MKLGRLSIHRPRGSMNNIVAWSYETGYWRWAIDWLPKPKGFGIFRSRSITGSIYPRFGFELVTPFGMLIFRTQPFIKGLTRTRWKDGVPGQWPPPSYRRKGK